VVREARWSKWSEKLIRWDIIEWEKKIREKLMAKRGKEFGGYGLLGPNFF